MAKTWNELRIDQFEYVMDTLKKIQGQVGQIIEQMSQHSMKTAFAPWTQAHDQHLGAIGKFATVSPSGYGPIVLGRWLSISLICRPTDSPANQGAEGVKVMTIQRYEQPQDSQSEFGYGDDMIPSDSGEWVKFADVEKLLAELSWMDQPDGPGFWKFFNIRKNKTVPAKVEVNGTHRGQWLVMFCGNDEECTLSRLSGRWKRIPDELPPNATVATSKE